MQRPQKTAKVGCPCEGMLETESNKGACSVAQLETERQDGAENLLEAILDRNNLNKAYLWCQLSFSFYFSNFSETERWLSMTAIISLSLFSPIPLILARSALKAS